MNARHPTEESPSVHDLYSDAAVSGRGLPDDYAAEQDRDCPETEHPQYTPAEEQEMYEAYVAGCIADGRCPSGYRSARCLCCYSPILVPEYDENPLCPTCELTTDGADAKLEYIRAMESARNAEFWSRNLACQKRLNELTRA